MENFKQDLDLPNSESNTETEFSRQVEECQSNLCRIEKLFFNLQNDGQKVLRKSQDSLGKSLNFSKKKLDSSYLDEQATLQEVYVKDRFYSDNSVTSGNKSINRNSSPLTFVVQVPNSIVDDFKKNLTSSDLLNFLSQCSSKQNMKVQKKKRISSLFRNLFKRKKTNMPDLNSLILKNMKFIKFLAESNQNDTNVFETSNESNIDQTSATENNLPIENVTNVDISKTNFNSQDGQTIVFPINFNSSTNIRESVKPNLIIQHEVTPKPNSSQYTHTIKITNEPLPDSHSQFQPKIVEEKVESEKKKLEKFSLNELQPDNSLMRNFIENLLRSTENFNDLEILKIFVEVLHEEKIKKKTSCCMDCSNPKISHKESNFLHNFLHQLMIDLQNKMKPIEKNVQQAPKRQSSKISICSSTAGISSEEEYIENPFISKSKRENKSVRRCQSPSLLKYRFCQSEKDIDKTETKGK